MEKKYKIIEEIIDAFKEIKKEWEAHVSQNICSICDSPKGHTSYEDFFSQILLKREEELRKEKDEIWQKGFQKGFEKGRDISMKAGEVFREEGRREVREEIKEEEKIINIIINKSDQILILTNKNKIYCQDMEIRDGEDKIIDEWFEVRNPINNKELLI